MSLKKAKVMVTGAGGFIGSFLTERLVEKGCSVKAIVKYNSQNSWGWLDTSSFKSEIEILSGDIRDYSFVKNGTKGIDIVFHLAALIGIPYSYISPKEYITTNIEGTYNILQAAREQGDTKVVHTSTSEVYGTAQFVPISEEHPLNPQSPYAATKAAADHLALSFFRSFGVPVSIIRPFNTYGPRQSARAIVPTIISQIFAKNEVELGSVHPTRDLTYVKDTVEGFMAVGESDSSEGDIVNIGMNSEISIKDLAELIFKLMKVDIKIVSAPERIRPVKSEVARLRADTAKAKILVGWAPKYSLEKGLSETIESIRQNRERYKPDIYNV